MYNYVHIHLNRYVYTCTDTYDDYDEYMCLYICLHQLHYIKLMTESRRAAACCMLTHADQDNDDDDDECVFGDDDFPS